MELVYRYGAHSEKDIFISQKENFDSIMLSLNLLEFSGKGVAGLISLIKKPYFIDPMTYIFPNDPCWLRNEGGSLKRTWKLFNSKYGSIIASVFNKRALNAADYKKGKAWNYNDIEEFIRCILDYQKNCINNILGVSSLIDYFDEGEITQFYPKALLSPYFYIHDINEWYDFSLIAGEIIKKIQREEKIPIYFTLCLSNNILNDPDKIDTITKDFAGFKGYALWLSELNERNANKDQLHGLIRLIQKFSVKKPEILNMFCGDFSLMLEKFGLTATSCGAGYGESKNATQMIGMGGPPSASMYIPKLFTRYPVQLAQILIKTIPKFSCNCSVCSNKLKELKKIDLRNFVDLYFSEMNIDYKLSREHFIAARNQITKKDVKITYSDLIANFMETKDAIIREPITASSIDINHLDRWALVLKEYI